MAKRETARQGSLEVSGPHPFAHLTAWREKAGLTQEQVANTFSVSGVTIHRWETGKAPVTVPNFIELAKLYGATDPAQLMFAPANRDHAEALRRAHNVIVNLPARQAQNWLTNGEDLASALGSPEKGDQRPE